MQKSLFTIKGINAVFEGYTDGTLYKGWAFPWFTKEVGEQIMQANNENHCYIVDQMHYDKEQDAFIQEFDDDLEVSKGYDIDGMHLYVIGLGSWSWTDLYDKHQNERNKMVIEYLQDVYHYLDCKQLYDAYYGIIQEINGYMTDKEVKIFADGFMTAFDRRK